MDVTYLGVICSLTSLNGLPNIFAGHEPRQKAGLGQVYPDKWVNAPESPVSWGSEEVPGDLWRVEGGLCLGGGEGLCQGLPSGSHIAHLCCGCGSPRDARWEAWSRFKFLPVASEPWPYLLPSNSGPVGSWN